MASHFPFFAIVSGCFVLVGACSITETACSYGDHSCSLTGAALLAARSTKADITTGLIHYYPFNNNANDSAGSLNGSVTGGSFGADNWGNAQTLESKLESRIDGVQAKLESKIDGQDSRISSLEEKFDSKIDGLRTEMREEMRRGFTRVHADYRDVRNRLDRLTDSLALRGLQLLEPHEG